MKKNISFSYFND